MVNSRPVYKLGARIGLDNFYKNGTLEWNIRWITWFLLVSTLFSDWINLRVVRTKAILFLKSKSERGGSDWERLWIRMTSFSIDFESIFKFINQFQSRSMSAPTFSDWLSIGENEKSTEWQKIWELLHMFYF